MLIELEEISMGYNITLKQINMKIVQIYYEVFTCIAKRLLGF